MTTTTFTDAVQIQGTQNVVQLSVQGPAGQTQPLQQWLNNSGAALAQITYDGRLQLGTNITGGPADALIQANYNPTGSQPTSVWHAPGTVSSMSQIGNSINWVFHELQLAGTAGVTSVHNALYTKLTNNNTGTATSAELRGATFQAVNQAGGAANPVGKVTGFRGIATNAANAFLGTAVGVEAYLSNDMGGSISQAVAFSVVPPFNNAGTIASLYGLQIPDITAGQTSNFAIQTGRGIISFGDRVGIGTTSPGQLLDLAYGHLRFTQVPAPGAPTAALAGLGAGNLSNGAYTYKVTFVTANGETALGTVSNTITVTSNATNGQISLTGISTGTVGNVTQRKIYRTKAGGSSYFLLTTIADNTTTTYTDNIADASLGANDATYIGNTTAAKIYVNGTPAGLLSDRNTAFGENALASNTTSYNNTAFGANTLSLNTTGSYNAAFGFNTLYNNTTGIGNTGLGYQVLYSNTTGGYNTGVGTFALNANSTGTQNTAVGYQALINNTTANNNTALGVNALYTNSTGTQNTAVGLSALFANTTANNNTAVGYAALNTNSTGIQNTAVGASALQNNTATNNTAVGMSALLTNTSGSGNVAVGVSALYFNTTASNNTSIGFNSLNQNSTGTQNTAVGTSALFSNTTANSNTAVGFAALNANSTGSNNTAVGYNTLAANVASNNTAVGYNTLAANVGGGANVALGYNALAANVSNNQNTALGFQTLQGNAGDNNTAVGNDALVSNTSGSNNTALGNMAGYTATPANANTSGSNNTFLGAFSGPGTTTQYNYAIAIGSGALVSTSNACVIGSATAGGSSSDVNLGVGTAAPTARAHFVLNDTATNAVGDVAILSHDSTGAIAANFGAALRIQGQDSTSADQNMVRLRGQWSTATHASRAAQGVLSAFDSTGERDVIGWGANGSARTLGFYGATQVVQPATTGTTAGFTAGTGTTMVSGSTFTGNTGSTAYTVSDIVLALKQLGLLAA